MTSQLRNWWSIEQTHRVIVTDFESELSCTNVVSRLMCAYEVKVDFGLELECTSTDISVKVAQQTEQLSQNKIADFFSQPGNS
jgi:hypothetical protein